MAMYLTHITTNQTKLGIHILFNERTTEVNNVKQPQAIHLAISETRGCRVTKLGDVTATTNSDGKQCVMVM